MIMGVNGHFPSHDPQTLLKYLAIPSIGAKLYYYYYKRNLNVTVINIA